MRVVDDNPSVVSCPSAKHRASASIAKTLEYALPFRSVIVTCHSPKEQPSSTDGTAGEAFMIAMAVP